MPIFLQRADWRLLLFGGKGGVGKTTCAAATALRLASRFPERRFLIVSTDPAHSLLDSFRVGSVLPNLEVLEIDSQGSLRRFKEAHGQHLRAIALRGTFFDEQDVTQLLDLSIPGLDEVMAFIEIAALVAQGDYASLIVDTAPTGHTLRLLALPEVLRKWLEALDALLAKHRYLAALYRRASRKDETDLFIEELGASVDRLASVLCDGRSTCFVPVLLAEPMAGQETRRLVATLERMKVPVADIIVNRLHPRRDDCPRCRSIYRWQEAELQKLCREFPKHPLWGIPLQGVEVRGPGQLATFWDGVARLEVPVGVERPARTPAKMTVPPPCVDQPAELPGPDVSLLLFAGKGGVGKTTLASATAFRLAQEYPDREVLLFSTDPAHSLSDCLGMRIGPRETRLCPGLTALEVDAEAEFEALRGQYADEVAAFFDSLSGGRMAIDLAFDRPAIEHVMDLSPPGLDEIMALSKVVELLEEKRYDLFVLDAAPTGHLIRLLELPGQVQEWLRVLFGLFLKYKRVFRLPKIQGFMVGLSKRVKTLRALMTDSHRAHLYVVSILTEMALEETKDLVAACRRVGIHVPEIFLNLATHPDDCPMCSQLAWIETLVRRKFEKTFDTLHHAVVYRCADPRGPVRLAELGHAAYRAPVCLPATSSERGETARLVTKAPVTPLLHATRWGVRAALTLPRAKQERESASGVVRRPSRRVGLKRSL